jgi:hypothetical protein
MVRLGKIFFLIIVTLGITGGCAKKHLPLTYELLSKGIDFSDISNGIEEFDAYAEAPPSKAFAAAVYADGTVHAWAKA